MKWTRWSMALVMASLLFAPPSSRGAEGPRAVVEALHTALLAVMKDADALGYAGRYERLAPVIKATFDFPFIARVAVGRYSSAFSDEARARYLDLFTRLSIATYAARFDGYSGQRFDFVSTEEGRPGRAMVRTLIIKPDGEEVELDYMLHETGTQWRVINVIAMGVSDLSLKRSDYTAFIEKNGIEAFLDKLAEKLRSYAQ